MSLHTRSLKYGKLRNGLLQPLSPHLIRRLKSHFHHLPPPCGPQGVDVILGLNGWVWVSAAQPESAAGDESKSRTNGTGTGQGQGQQGDGFDAEGVYSNVNDVSLTVCNCTSPQPFLWLGPLIMWSSTTQLIAGRTSLPILEQQSVPSPPSSGCSPNTISPFQTLCS